MYTTAITGGTHIRLILIYPNSSIISIPVISLRFDFFPKKPNSFNILKKMYLGISKSAVFIFQYNIHRIHTIENCIIILLIARFKCGFHLHYITLFHALLYNPLFFIRKYGQRIDKKMSTRD